MLRKIIKFIVGSDSYICIWIVFDKFCVLDVWLLHYFILWSLRAVVGGESIRELVGWDCVLMQNVFGEAEYKLSLALYDSDRIGDIKTLLQTIIITEYGSYSWRSNNPLMTSLVIIIPNVCAQVCIDKDVYQWDIVMTGNSSHSHSPHPVIFHTLNSH